MSRVWLGILIALILSWAVTPQVKKLACRVGAMDLPGGRKIHQHPTARFGGLAIYAGFMGGLIMVQPSLSLPLSGLLLGGGLVLVLGIIDDRWGLNPWIKLLGQVAAASVLVLFNVRVEFLSNPFDGLLVLGEWAIPVTILWIVGITNALNLIDGMDGLAGGTAAIAAITIAVVAWLKGQAAVAMLAMILAAGILGFLRYNLHPAQIFLGDSGSMFLGFNLAALAAMGLTKSATIISLLVPVVILGMPILDTFLAIVRRLRAHRPVFQADKGHLHHRLLDLGLPYRRAVWVMYGLDLCLGISAVMLVFMTTAQSVILLVVLAAAGVAGIDWLVSRGRKLARSKQREGSRRGVQAGPSTVSRSSGQAKF